MSAITDAIDKLQAEVDQLTTVEQSAVSLLGSLSQLLKDNASSPTSILAIADKIDAAKNDLAAAISANTPV